MLSICIPVYNYNVTSLVNELSKQAELTDKPYEIILIDDCSDKNFKEINKSISKNNIYIELPENIGRSKIRNLFLKFAKYKYLLFLDCDIVVESTDFLSKYFNILGENPGVVCGGRIYNKSRPVREKMLRWKYGIFRESQSVSVRKKNPNKSFMTNNFLINREIFAKVKFDERITKYGHEDTLFGYSLKKENIPITHIDNPVVNMDLESNSEYLNKTKEGIINLIDIIEFTNYNKGLIDDITILRFYWKVRKSGKIINLFFILLKPLVVYLLSRGYVNLYLFDFYKLGIFIENKKQRPDRTI